MRVNFLKTFMEVISAGSFLEAAKRLRITQATVSNQIAALEEYFGAKLFMRTREGANLTEEGKILEKRARQILDLVNIAKKEIINSLNKLKGVIKIAASTIPGEHILPIIAGKFKKAYPDIEIEIEIGDTGTSVKKLIEGHVDFAAIGSLMGAENLYETKVIAKERLVIITSLNHELSNKKAVDLSEVLNYPFISREQSSGTKNEIDKIFNERNIPLDELKIVLELGSTESVITAVSEGIGVSIISSIAAEKAKAAGLVDIIEIKNARNWRELFLVRLKKMEYLEEQQKFWKSVEKCNLN
ncbi:MAG: selenium metabolism-associated LysR family transcriptional regulator [Candidatus Jordarchaeum sp.]|uniref:selenium metabolism-associated LysR family transcriptional regulator n=1 Tax=Candidatus Jordarchaeum sp. TaxID=2823881 RepID=UPI0040492A5D